MKAKTAQAIADEVDRARRKHPGNHHLTVALMEELGELAQAQLKQTNVREEAIQVAAVAVRIIEEGDASFEGWLGEDVDVLIIDDPLPPPEILTRNLMKAEREWIERTYRERLTAMGPGAATITTVEPQVADEGDEELCQPLGRDQSECIRQIEAGDYEIAQCFLDRLREAAKERSNQGEALA